MALFILFDTPSLQFNLTFKAVHSLFGNLGFGVKPSRPEYFASSLLFYLSPCSISTLTGAECNRASSFSPKEVQLAKIFLHLI